MKKNNQIVGCLLLGGQSKRMQTPKHNLPVLSNQKLWQLQLNKLLEVFTDVIILGNEQQQNQFTNYRFLKDKYNDIGPLNGIYTALQTLQKPCFILAVDLPLITTSIINQIINFHKNNYLGTLPKTKQIEPLCGIYEPSCLPIIEQSIIIKSYGLINIIKNSNFQLIKNLNSNLFFNLNSPDDWLKYSKTINKC